MNLIQKNQKFPPPIRRASRHISSLICSPLLFSVARIRFKVLSVLMKACKATSFFSMDPVQCWIRGIAALQFLNSFQNQRSNIHTHFLLWLAGSVEVGKEPRTARLPFSSAFPFLVQLFLWPFMWTSTRNAMSAFHSCFKEDWIPDYNMVPYSYLWNLKRWFTEKSLLGFQPPESTWHLTAKPKICQHLLQG